jgi:hypothetical protein
MHWRMRFFRSDGQPPLQQTPGIISEILHAAPKFCRLEMAQMSDPYL